MKFNQSSKIVTLSRLLPRVWGIDLICDRVGLILRYRLQATLRIKPGFANKRIRVVHRMLAESEKLRVIRAEPGIFTRVLCQLYNRLLISQSSASLAGVVLFASLWILTRCWVRIYVVSHSENQYVFKLCQRLYSKTWLTVFARTRSNDCTIAEIILVSSKCVWRDCKVCLDIVWVSELLKCCNSIAWERGNRLVPLQSSESEFLFFVCCELSYVNCYRIICYDHRASFVFAAAFYLLCNKVLEGFWTSFFT